jgi:hypothetical protein
VSRNRDTLGRVKGVAGGAHEMEEKEGVQSTEYRRRVESGIRVDKDGRGRARKKSLVVTLLV